MHKEARLNTNEMLTKTVQTGHPKDWGETHAPTLSESGVAVFGRWLTVSSSINVAYFETEA
ncbi:hypothetical protein BDW66DRAFT_130591 [Aspergillus desertorum]